MTCPVAATISMVVTQFATGKLSYYHGKSNTILQNNANLFVEQYKRVNELTHKTSTKTE